MRRAWMLLGMVLVLGAVACTRGGSGPGVIDAPDPQDASSCLDGGKADASMADGGISDGRIDARGDGGLDPELELPDPFGEACTKPGLTDSGCPEGEACRFFTATEGRCESCFACRGVGMPCSASNDCDTIAVCFRGECVSFCRLGTTECGTVDCLNIGHATIGVCNPDA